MRRTRLTDVPSKAPLSDSVAAVVLSGWGARPPGGRSAEDDGGLFELFQAGDAGCVRLWREHETWLRSLAAAWGVAPDMELPDGRVVFFGEFAGLLLKTQHAYWLRVGAEAVEAMQSDRRSRGVH